MNNIKKLIVAGALLGSILILPTVAEAAVVEKNATELAARGGGRHGGGGHFHGGGGRHWDGGGRHWNHQRNWNRGWNRSYRSYNYHPYGGGVGFYYSPYNYNTYPYYPYYYNQGGTGIYFSN